MCLVRDIIGIKVVSCPWHSAGGVLWVEGSTVDFKNATFSGCAASGHGGAIFADTDSAVSGSGSTFVNNTAGGRGGAIYQSGFFPAMQGAPASAPRVRRQCPILSCHAAMAVWYGTALLCLTAEPWLHPSSTYPSCPVSWGG